jgi:methionyl-tRNA formyltransferase
MLPEVVWAMPPLGTFNLHAALLPQYRGAAPINWAVINGDKETGVTTFFLDHDIDTGRIILQERIPILPEDNAGTIHDRMMEVGSDLVVRTVGEIIAGTAKAIPQEQFLTDAPLRHAPKIFRETCQILWNEHTALSAHNLVRGLSPYPAAWTNLVNAQGKPAALKVYRTTLTGKRTDCTPVGSIQTDGKSFLHVALPDEWLALEEIQLAGKKRMSVTDFLRGTRLEGCTLQ